MNAAEANELGKRIMNAWRGGPPLAEWVEELAQPDIDAGAAGTAFARLKRTMEHAPSIARFFAEYRSIDTHDGGNTIACDDCSGSGWVAWEDIAGDALQYAAHGEVYSGVRPCRCSAGQIAERSKLWQNAPRRHWLTTAQLAERREIA